MAAALDREAVAETFEVGALDVAAPRTGEFLKRLRPHLLNAARKPNVVASDGAPLAGAAAAKRLLFSRSLDAGDPLAGLPADARAFLAEEIGGGRARLARHSITHDYGYFTASEVLSRILPEGVPTPSAFEMCGHVAHLNLRPEHGPHKGAIAAVLLDKVAGVRTVVNKVGDIDAEFRTYDMEVLGGDPETRVELRESGCVFHFDVRDVYWNSRLQSEHARLAETIPFGSVVADCTCGVGPFSVPLAARRKIRCFANDLNPAAVLALRGNADRNGCGDLLRADGPGCARDFLRNLIVAEGIPVTHALYNLPAAGVELLDVFQDLDAEPIVHCYTFAGASKGRAAAESAAVVAAVRDRVAAAVGRDLPAAANGGLPLPSPDAAEAAELAEGGAFVVRWVRNVSPNKDMYCASFRVPPLGRKRPRGD